MTAMYSCGSLNRINNNW